MFVILCLIVPDAKASLIVALCYGAGIAIGFRLFWEFRDLVLYKRASKMDRYAMLYCAFKGDVRPRHITGVMIAKGYSKEDADIVRSYMEKVKIEAIANDSGYAKITVEKRLTELAKSLYDSR